MEPVDILLNSIQNNVRQVELISHNVANANTPGFQSNQVFAVHRENAQAELVQQAVTVSQQGIITTDRALDVALLDDAYFTVEKNGDVLLTRHGRFHIGANGELRHSSGDRVLGEQGVIALAAGHVQISAEGRVTVNGEYVDKLLLVRPSNSQDVVSMGKGLMRAEHINVLQQAQVQQGAINGASADITQDMVRLIELSRHTQSMQKAILAIDQMRNAGINELGKK